MFVTSESGYLQAVKNVLEFQNEQVVYFAVAFWGKGAESLFTGLPTGITVRIICNLTSGGTNPETIRALQALGDSVSVRQLNDLHAKVVCGDKEAIIGSANCSTNGLALQGQQCAGWREAGVVTKSETQLKDIRDWLDKLWESAKKIEDNDLDLAMVNWSRRRALTNKEDTDQFIFDECFGKDYWEGKPVYLAIWNEEASQQADEEYKKIKQREDQNSDANGNALSVLDFYENWPELPIDATLVSVWYENRSKKAKVEDTCYRRLPALDVQLFKTETGEDSSLQIVQEELGLGEFPFRKKEIAAIQKKLNEKVDGITRVNRLWNTKPLNKLALFVPFSELFD